MSELISALQRHGDIPDEIEMNTFYSKLNRAYKDTFVDIPAAVCEIYKISSLEESMSFACGMLKIKIHEPHSLVLLASACSAVSVNIGATKKTYRKMS